MPKNLSVNLRKEQLYVLLNVTTDEEFELSRKRGHASRKLNAVVDTIWKNQEKYFKVKLSEHGMLKKQLHNKIKPMMKYQGAESVTVFEFESSRKSRSSTQVDEAGPSKVCRLDQNQSLNMSIDETSDHNMSIDQSMEQFEMIELRRELEELRSWKKKYEPVTELFARSSSTHYAVGPKVYEMGLSLLGEAFSCTDIAKMFSTIAMAFPVLLKENTPGVKYAIPSHDTFNRIRDDIKHLTDTQTNEWIEQATNITATCDGTTTDKNSHSLYGMGLINQLGEFHCFGSTLVTSSSGDEVKEDMMKMLPNEVKAKLSGILSDKERKQVKANRLVMEEISEETGNDLMGIDCSLHSYSNQGNRFNRNAPKNVSKTLKSISIVFGSTIGSGYHSQSLRGELADYLQVRKLRLSKIWFASDIGSRIGTQAANSLATILYRNQMVQVLKQAIANKNEASRKAKKEPLEDSRWIKLLNELQENWQYNLTYMGTIVLFHQLLLKEYERVVQINLTVSQTQEILRLVLQRYESITSEETNQFKRLFSLSILADLSPPIKQAIKMVENACKTLNSQEKKELDEIIGKACNDALEKFNQDNQKYLQLEPSNDILPTSNRPQEAFFSHYKVSIVLISPILKQLFSGMNPDSCDSKTDY